MRHGGDPSAPQPCSGACRRRQGRRARHWPGAAGQLASASSSERGVSTWRSRIRSRNPGASASTSASFRSANASVSPPSQRPSKVPEASPRTSMGHPVDLEGGGASLGHGEAVRLAETAQEPATLQLEPAHITKAAGAGHPSGGAEPCRRLHPLALRGHPGGSGGIGEEERWKRFSAAPSDVSPEAREGSGTVWARGAAAVAQDLERRKERAARRSV